MRKGLIAGAATALILTFAFITISANSRLVQDSPFEREGMAADEYFVSFRDGLTEENMRMAGAPGVTIRRKFSEINVLTVKSGDWRIMAALQKDPRVEYVEPVPMRYASGLTESQLTPLATNGLYGLITTRAMEVQAKGITGQGINVGVVDTGIDYTHPDIAPVYKGGIDTASDDNDPFWDNDPRETHGTHVAGTIIAANNSIGILGVAYNVNLYHVRALARGSGRSSDIMDGVRWLVEQAGCKVVNLSLGGPSASSTEKKFYKEMYKKGALIVAASGNDGEGSLSFPAGIKTNIAVGAVDRNNLLADFSNFGKNLDVVAPGVSVLSSVPIGTGQEIFVSTDATFGALELEFSGKTSGITKTMVFCGKGKPEEFPAAAAGNIALILRGDFTFAEKVTNAMNAGASAVIIYNNEPSGFAGTLGESKTSDGRNWVPAVGVSGVTGEKLKAQALSGAQSTVVNQVSNWDHYSGTSMATPHAAGVIALIWSIDPTMPNTAVENILYTSCKDLGAAGYDAGFGHGLVDAAAAAAKLGK